MRWELRIIVTELNAAHSVVRCQRRISMRRRYDTPVRAVRLSALGAVVAFVCLFAAPGAQAQQFPNGPVRWILPEPTGGNFDNLARGIAPALSRQLKVPVVVQNI